MSIKIALIYLFLFFNLPINQKDILPNGFIYLNCVIPDTMLDLRYFSSNNFVGDTIDGYHANKCIISFEAAMALTKVQNELESMGYGIKVFDAYRPQQAVDHFVRWAQDLRDAKMKNDYYPDVDKNLLFEKGYIASRSGHSRGSTIDLTIINIAGLDIGKELDMGTPWDFFSPMSWTSSDRVTAEQKINRMLLHEVMIKYGFSPLKQEWWHFTLKEEPFPDTYFTFSIE